MFAGRIDFGSKAIHKFRDISALFHRSTPSRDCALQLPAASSLLLRRTGAGTVSRVSGILFCQVAYEWRSFLRGQLRHSGLHGAENSQLLSTPRVATVEFVRRTDEHLQALVRLPRSSAALVVLTVRMRPCVV